VARSSIPTWSELFGALDTKEADSGRAITAPAAYLADLLQLLEDRFDSSDFRNRRPDIPKALKLNGDQSFTLTRQLHIANALLAERIERQALAAVAAATVAGGGGAGLIHAQPQQGPSAESILGRARRPFLLPFEYQHERIRQILLLLRTQQRELHTAFVPQIDVDVLARERLGLSPARAATVVQDLSGDTTGLRDVYGLAPNEPLSALVDLERFRQATQLDAASLGQLLFSQLSQIAVNTGGAAERDAAASLLFINHDLGGFVKLDTNEQRLVWSSATAGIPDAWFDRVHRLLCLSRWTGLDLPSLDLFLRQLCGNTLDLNALRRLAVLVDLRDRTGAALDELCAILSELDGEAALGAGDDLQNPASLFDRVFNGDRALLSKRFLRSGSDYLPKTFTM